MECEPMHPDAEGWSEWIHPLPGYLMQCCDCGLIHEAQFQIGEQDGDGPLNPGEGDDGVVIFRMRRYAAQGMAAPSGGETGTGSTVGNSPVGNADAPNPHPHSE